ncbi:Skn1 protein [Limtongia smithiae]|uniref:Skn1 protein n=1 Tax=Limtongia smithiae TaxID=1125753 RepID=UPI0034CDEF83
MRSNSSRGRAVDPFASPSPSATDLSDRLSVHSDDYSVRSDMALRGTRSVGRANANANAYEFSGIDSQSTNTATSAAAMAAAAAAFQHSHGDHVHNSRQAVFSSSSSLSSLSHPSSEHSVESSSYDRYPTGSRLSGSNAYIGGPHYSSRMSSSANLYPHNLGDPTSAQGAVSNDPDFSPFGGYPVSLFPLHIDEKEPDDYLHNPDPLLDSKSDRRWYEFDTRGLGGAASLALLVLGAVAVFIILPVLTFSGHTGVSHGTKYVTAPLSNYKYNILSRIRTNLIDEDTPESAYTTVNKDGKKMVLVFSDEFNTDGRTFYANDDQFWEAPDFNYAATTDLEWYDPDAITTKNGTLIITLDAFHNHNLDYRSGMLQSWNKLCFKGGRVSVSVSLPGMGSVNGLWPGLWTMGNLGRPGYRATTDGLWPYTYQSCDVGITPNQSSADGMNWLPGQRLNSCTCKGYEHPNQGVGRSAPEIDIIEGSVGNYNPSDKVGVASQSLQIAPMDIWYMPDYDYLVVFNNSVTAMNSWNGGPYQQAISGITALNNEWYEGEEKVGNLYQSYGFEYEPGTEGYVQWHVGETSTYAIHGLALRPNGNIGARPIPLEPMSIVMNLGLSNSWSYIDWPSIDFPAHLRIDYVRIYQFEGNESITCDPEGYPTTDYIAAHPKAYQNMNVTSWEGAGYEWPQNTFMHGCDM